MNINDDKKDNIFLDFASHYERMINWPERLARETPFFKKAFADAGVNKVLDAACGIGHHAIMFRSWALRVSGVDVSSDMVTVARENTRKAGLDVDFRAAGLAEIDKVFENDFDAVTCLGNSLPHVRTDDELLKVFGAVGSVLKPGGQFIMQIRNYRRVIGRNERFMPLNSTVEQGKEYLYLRMNEIHEGTVVFNIFVLTRDEAGKWSYHVETENLKPWVTEDLEDYLHQCRFTVVAKYGGFARQPFVPLDSTDLIIVASKYR